MVLPHRLVGNVAAPHATSNSYSTEWRRQQQRGKLISSESLIACAIVGIRLSPENNWSNFPFPILEQGSSQKSGVRSRMRSGTARVKWCGSTILTPDSCILLHGMR